MAVRSGKMEKYSIPYTIRTYECDAQKTLRLVSLFNLLQAAATDHADRLGVGFYDLAAKGVFWVYVSYDIRIARLPTWDEKVVLTTWPSETTTMIAVRELQMKTQDGEVLVNASCRFAMLDAVRLRPVSVVKNLTDKYQVVPERAVDEPFARLPLPETWDAEKRQSVRYDDIDMNGHVNNSIYPVYAQDALSADFLKDNVLRQIRVEFKKSAVADDEIISKVLFTGNETFHSVCAPDGREFARIAMAWDKKTNG